ncbi:MAG: glycosyltransferase family 39 protein [bacterium]|nr:glycosyltransferase family 39 protein [bacterium]
MSNKKIIIIFVLLIGFQTIFSFLSPAYNDSFYWKTIEELDFYKGYTLDTFDDSLAQKIYPLVKNYRMNLDGGGYLLLAHDFPQHYFKGNVTFLTRPLYPILVNWAARPLHLISDSYSMTFAAGLLVNLILFFFTVYLFYLLVKKIISHRVAFLSSLLLIFSPLAHVWLIQPETNILGIFTVILSLYLLYKYIKHPTLKKLIIFSLIIGILILGKKLFAISIFILLLALFFKRFKEGIIFFVVHLIPLALWGFWVTKIWGLNFYIDEVASFGVGIWIFDIFHWPWYHTLQVFIESLPRFISSVIYGFLVIPVIFAFIGYRKLSLVNKNILYFSFILSFFILLFLVNIYFPRYGFLTFPFVYPLAVLGIDKIAGYLKKYKNWYAFVFYILAYGSMIIISSLNIYQFVYYG